MHWVSGVTHSALKAPPPPATQIGCVAELTTFNRRVVFGQANPPGVAVEVGLAGVGVTLLLDVGVGSGVVLEVAGGAIGVVVGVGTIAVAVAVGTGVGVGPIGVCVGMMHQSEAVLHLSPLKGSPLKRFPAHAGTPSSAFGPFRQQ